MEADLHQTKEERLAVKCRPARQADTADVMELTKHIWQGEDYIPSVWNKWLADPQGLLAVAEYEGRVLGLAKLSRLSDEDWWLEGMRVHPEFERRGIGSQIFEYLFDSWLEIGGGIVRLITASTRFPVHHMCERLGFEKVMEIAPFIALTVKDQNAESFQLLTLAEVPDALTFILRSESLNILTHGLIDLSWQWAKPRPSHLEEMVENKRAWWWRERNGLIAWLLDEDEVGTGVFPILQFVACPLNQFAACLEDFRHLAGTLGYEKALCTAPLQPELLPKLQQAGFQRNWDHSLYLYAKDHPERPAGG